MQRSNPHSRATSLPGNTRWGQGVSSLIMIAITIPCALGLHAQNKPVIGSPNVAVADPVVPKPGTKPCTVQLFPREDFGPAGADTRMDAVPHTFTYQPPERCKAPWAKVVLEADFCVDAGHQYDRTASIWLGGVNLYFGTTEEPSPDLAPSWRVERDLTDYSSLLRSPGKGFALVNNWVDSRRASIIHASARLLFYPAGSHFPAPRTPDAIYPLNTHRNAPANLQSGTETLVRKVVFPRNTVRVYLDVIAQSQFHDEFWYTCLPDQYIQQTTAFAMRRGYKGAPVHPRACSGGSYRETGVSVDGQPAGLAPVSPWVFTGGIDPYLWRPTPGVQTLNFAPYRIDLTPFAGLLSDGMPHSVAVRVLGANHYFSVAAALLVYRDPKAPRTRGAITRNTLAGANLEPAITGTLGHGTGGANGDVLTRAKQGYLIEGYVDGSAGKVRTGVEENISFTNKQNFATPRPHAYRHTTEQTTHVEETSSSSGAPSAKRQLQQSFDYSLRVDVLRSSTGRARTRTVHMRQSFDKRVAQREAGRAPYRAAIRNARMADDQAAFAPMHPGITGSAGRSSTQVFSFTDSLGDCYRAQVKAVGGKVSSFTGGQGCSGRALEWFVHPKGWPESFGWVSSR